MTTVCIHQPDFAPWLGFFERLLHCQRYIVLDHVQFVRRGWHHRDKIKTVRGVQWLTVPTRNKGSYDAPIRDMRVDDEQPWRARHLRTLASAYGRAAYFADTYPELERIYGRKQLFLLDFNMDILTWMLEIFDIHVEITLSSDLPAKGAKSELLLSILKAVRADTYITGMGSQVYLDEALFAANGVTVLWQSFDHPLYPQLHGPFAANLSSLDALFNCGRDAARLIRGTAAPSFASRIEHVSKAAYSQ